MGNSMTNRHKDIKQTVCDNLPAEKARDTNGTLPQLCQIRRLENDHLDSLEWRRTNVMSSKTENATAKVQKEFKMLHYIMKWPKVMKVVWNDVELAWCV